MFQSEKDYLISRHLALITHDATYVVNSSIEPGDINTLNKDKN